MQIIIFETVDIPLKNLTICWQSYYIEWRIFENKKGINHFTDTIAHFDKLCCSLEIDLFFGNATSSFLQKCIELEWKFFQNNIKLFLSIFHTQILYDINELNEKIISFLFPEISMCLLFAQKISVEFQNLIFKINTILHKNLLLNFIQARLRKKFSQFFMPREIFMLA